MWIFQISQCEGEKNVMFWFWKQRASKWFLWCLDGGMECSVWVKICFLGELSSFEVWELLDFGEVWWDFVSVLGGHTWEWLWEFWNSGNSPEPASSGITQGGKLGFRILQVEHPQLELDFRASLGPFHGVQCPGGVTEDLQSLNPLGFFGGWRIFLGAGPHWGEPCSPKFTPLLSDLIFVTFPRSLCGIPLVWAHRINPSIPAAFLSHPSCQENSFHWQMLGVFFRCCLIL